jgi:hypothetical protein
MGQQTVTFYVYNVTNPADVLRGAKPNVSELPALVYDYHSLKLNVSWPPDSGECNTMSCQGHGNPCSEASYNLRGVHCTPCCAGGDVVQYQQMDWYTEAAAANSSEDATFQRLNVTTVNVPLLALLSNPITRAIVYSQFPQYKGMYCVPYAFHFIVVASGTL